MREQLGVAGMSMQITIGWKNLIVEGSIAVLKPCPMICQFRGSEG